MPVPSGEEAEGKIREVKKLMDHPVHYFLRGLASDFFIEISVYQNLQVSYVAR
jgi:hypothetical protein